MFYVILGKQTPSENSKGETVNTVKDNIILTYKLNGSHGTRNSLPLYEPIDMLVTKKAYYKYEVNSIFFDSGSEFPFYLFANVYVNNENDLHDAIYKVTLG